MREKETTEERNSYTLPWLEHTERPLLHSTYAELRHGTFDTGEQHRRGYCTHTLTQTYTILRWFLVAALPACCPFLPAHRRELKGQIDITGLSLLKPFSVDLPNSEAESFESFC